MKVTAITSQARGGSRVNIMVEDKYRFSLDILQLSELGVTVGQEYSDAELEALEREGQFSKVYTRALEYCLARPRSVKEVRDYLYKKQLSRRTKTGSEIPGIPKEISERVVSRLVGKGHLSDEHFARYWTEIRNLRKGASRRRLTSELMSKGIAKEVIEHSLSGSERSEADELDKVIAKKSYRYTDERKLIQYLLRQGFSYDTIKERLSSLTQGESEAG